jgi:hypothetical protein
MRSRFKAAISTCSTGSDDRATAVAGPVVPIAQTTQATPTDSAPIANRLNGPPIFRLSVHPLGPTSPVAGSDWTPDLTACQRCVFHTTSRAFGFRLLDGPG